jgi:hypothetical protein
MAAINGFANRWQQRSAASEPFAIAAKQKGRRGAGLFFEKLASECDQYFATTGPPKV